MTGLFVLDVIRKWPFRERRDGFNYSVTYMHAASVKKALELGADPNYCKGLEGWFDSNPLDLLAIGLSGPSPKASELPDDIKIFNYLMEAGADINRRPYIWHRVYTNSNSLIIDNMRRSHDVSKTPEEMEKEAAERINFFMENYTRLLKAYLEAGADPDRLGHPYPYSYESFKDKMTDEKANRYFAAGTRAINESIKKGLMWEREMDLLLQYTTLDEDSLKIAEESGDPVLIEKINRIWMEQQTAQ
jgi:hypothetical protein